MATVPSYRPSRYETPLRDRQQIAEGTMAFYLQRPAGFEFRAGQALDLTLIEPPETDAEGNTRAFSIASSPFESDHLMVATRMRDTAFKRALKTLPLGTNVRIEGPSGSFTLHNNAKKPAVFLIGGIGITPVLSILRQATREKRPHQLYLFYSNRRPEDAAFMDELQGLAAENSNLHFIPSMTQMSKSRQTWNGETGFITQAMVAQYLKEMQGPIYYMAGPPAMVAAMRDMLVDAQVDEDDIRTEEFSGY
ncbi:MAG: FAD-dependent oxidoreductase [Terriglobales bacterium]